MVQQFERKADSTPGSLSDIILCLRKNVSAEQFGHHLSKESAGRSNGKKTQNQGSATSTECPLSHCMQVLAGAWTAHVLWYLREGERCFTELQLDIGKISAKMLTNCLRRLEREGIIARSTRTTSPPTVWYHLTPVGQELRAALVNVIDVAQRLKRADVVRSLDD